jgi:hypothetical protein
MHFRLRVIPKIDYIGLLKCTYLAFLFEEHLRSGTEVVGLLFFFLGSITARVLKPIG